MTTASCGSSGVGRAAPSGHTDAEEVAGCEVVVEHAGLLDQVVPRGGQEPRQDKHHQEQ
jgi:hypothetical protein